MDQNSSQLDDLLMAMLSYSPGATNIGTLNSEDGPRELCNSLYAPTAHEVAPWPVSNDAALDDVPTQPRILDLDSDIDFGLDSLDNDLNIPSTMQLASDTRNVPSYEYSSFDPSPIHPPEINVKKGEKKCPYCSKQFVGGAAAVRKHIERMHIKKGQIEGEVIRSTPGRAKAKKIHEDVMRLATKRRRVDDDDARAYLPLATQKRFEETTHITVQEFRDMQNKLFKMQKQHADLQVLAMRLQAGMNNQSHDILERSDKSFEEHLFESLEKIKMAGILFVGENARRARYRQLFEICSLIDTTVRTRYPKQMTRCKLVLADGVVECSISSKLVVLYEKKHEKEKASREEPSVKLSIDVKFDSMPWSVNRGPDCAVSGYYSVFTMELRKGKKNGIAGRGLSSLSTEAAVSSAV